MFEGIENAASNSEAAAVKEEFHITDESSANWVLRKIAGNAAEIARNPPGPAQCLQVVDQRPHLSAGERSVRPADKVLDRVRADVLSALPAEDRDVFLRALGTLARGRLAEPVACAHPVRRRA